MDLMRPHDPISYIDPRANAFGSLNAPIPVPLLMPNLPPTMPSPFFNPNGQMINANSKSTFIK